MSAGMARNFVISKSFLIRFDRLTRISEIATKLQNQIQKEIDEIYSAKTLLATEFAEFVMDKLMELWDAKLLKASAPSPHILRLQTSVSGDLHVFVSDFRLQKKIRTGIIDEWKYGEPPSEWLVALEKELTAHDYFKGSVNTYSDGVARSNYSNVTLKFTAASTK
jgi:hypothetical protein